MPNSTTMEDAHADLVTRLRSGAHLANPPRLATMEPSDPSDAAGDWARETGWKRGACPTPPARYLVPLLARWCASRGWGIEPTHRQLGKGVVAAGFAKTQAGARGAGYRVDSATAQRLWEAVRLAGCPLEPRKRARKPTPPKVRPYVLAEMGQVGKSGGKRRAVVDSTHRVYPSVSWAARLARVCQPIISKAARTRGVAAGRRWRFLEPSEVASLHPKLRAGDCAEGITW